MNALSQRFREQANEIAQQTAELLDGGTSSDTLKAQLSALLGLETVAEIKARIEILLQSLPSDSQIPLTAAVTAGPIKAFTLRALADIVDVIVGLRAVDGQNTQRSKVAKYSHRLRTAATSGAFSGDWSDFQRIYDERIEEIKQGHSAAEVGGAGSARGNGEEEPT